MDDVAAEVEKLNKTERHCHEEVDEDKIQVSSLVKHNSENTPKLSKLTIDE